jgi:hypothetical protein
MARTACLVWLVGTVNLYHDKISLWVCQYQTYESLQIRLGMESGMNINGCGTYPCIQVLDWGGYVQHWKHNSLKLHSISYSIEKGFIAQSTDKSEVNLKVRTGNTKGGSITVPMTSCLTGLD